MKSIITVVLVLLSYLTCFISPSIGYPVRSNPFMQEEQGKEERLKQKNLKDDDDTNIQANRLFIGQIQKEYFSKTANGYEKWNCLTRLDHLLKSKGIDQKTLESKPKKYEDSFRQLLPIGVGGAFHGLQTRFMTAYMKFAKIDQKYINTVIAFRKTYLKGFRNKLAYHKKMEKIASGELVPKKRPTPLIAQVRQMNEKFRIDLKLLGIVPKGDPVKFEEDSRKLIDHHGGRWKSTQKLRRYLNSLDHLDRGWIETVIALRRSHNEKVNKNQYVEVKGGQQGSKRRRGKSSFYSSVPDIDGSQVARGADDSSAGPSQSSMEAQYHALTQPSGPHPSLQSSLPPFDEHHRVEWPNFSQLLKNVESSNYNPVNQHHHNLPGPHYSNFMTLVNAHNEGGTFTASHSLVGPSDSQGPRYDDVVRAVQVQGDGNNFALHRQNQQMNVGATTLIPTQQLARTVAGGQGYHHAGSSAADLHQILGSQSHSFQPAFDDHPWWEFDMQSQHGSRH